MAAATKYVQTFGSVAEMLAACDRAIAAGSRDEDGEEYFQRESFIGRDFAGWKDVRESAEAPWPEGLGIIQALLSEIDAERIDLPASLDVRRRRRWSADDGDEVCLDRLRAGQDAWQTTARVSVSQPRQVTIFANVSTPASVPSADVLWRGAAAIVLADLLEREGYRVELHMVRYSEGTHPVPYKHTTSATCARLKAMSDPLDISAVVNAMAGWFFRSVVFQASYAMGPRVSEGQGSAKVMTADLDFVVDMSRGSTPIVMDGVFSRAAALSLICKTVAELAA